MQHKRKFLKSLRSSRRRSSFTGSLLGLNDGDFDRKIREYTKESLFNVIFIFVTVFMVLAYLVYNWLVTTMSTPY